jgi:NADH-quinone oxidoreductase subunit G
VHQDPVLNVSERGDRAVIGKAPDAGLTQPWAANVVDLCPVGALLSKDFLNKARAWEVDRTASVCTGCSQGCNTVVEVRDNVVVRLKPRGNDDVNKFFMCDHGRLDYRWMNRPDRLEAPAVAAAAGALALVDWEIALDAAAKALKGKRAYVVANPSLSNEALFLLKTLIARAGGEGRFRVETGLEAPLPGVNDLALRADRAANVRGAELLGFSRSQDVLAGLRDGDVLVVADDEMTGVPAEALARARAVIVVGTAMPHGLANVVAVLPLANVAEEEGTFTNLRGRVQRFLQAKAAPGLARPSWYVLSDLLIALGETAGFLAASSVFDAMARTEPAFAGLSYDDLGLKGAPARGAGQQPAGTPS